MGVDGGGRGVGCFLGVVIDIRNVPTNRPCNPTGAGQVGQ